MRRFAAIFISAGALVLVACFGGNDGEPAETGGASSVATTEAGTTAPSTTDDTTTIPAEDDPEPARTLSDLLADPQVSQVDRSLAEFALLIGDMPGAPTVIDDGSAWPTATHALDGLVAARDQLTAEQQAVLDETLERLEQVEPVAAFPVVIGEGGVPEPEARRPFRTTASGLAATPASDTIRREVERVGAEVSAIFGGAPIAIWVEIVPNGTYGDADARASAFGDSAPIREEILDEYGVRTDCRVHLTESVVEGDRLTDGSNARGVVAHEVTHCWQGQILNEFSDIGVGNDTDRWAWEGIPAFVGEQVGGITRFSSAWWNRYLTEQVGDDGVWALYPSEYAAIGFWSRIAEIGDFVAAARGAMIAAPDNGAMLAAALDTVGDLNQLVSGTAQRPDWGSLWTAGGPGNPGTARKAGTRTVRYEDDVVTESSDPGTQRNLELTVFGVPDSPGSLLTVTVSGVGIARVAATDVVSAVGPTMFCVDDCVCPDGVKPIPSERTLATGGTVYATLGGMLSTSSISLSQEVFNPDDFDCENPDLGEPAADGLVGTWRANPDSVASVFEQASAFGDEATPFDVLGASGDVIMTFAEDGTGTLSYNDVTIFISDEILGDLTINGSGTFRWGGAGDGIRIDGTTFSYSIGSSALGGEILTITDADVPQAGVTSLAATIADDELVVSDADGTAGEVFFPMLWVRQTGE